MIIKKKIQLNNTTVVKRTSYNGTTGCHGPSVRKRVTVVEDTVTERGTMARMSIGKLRDVIRICVQLGAIGHPGVIAVWQWK